MLYRRWSDAEAARLAAEAALAECQSAAGAAERAVRAATEARAEAEAELPPLREEEAIAAALVQRLSVEPSTLAEREAQARAAVTALEERIAQLSKDSEREAALNRDAGDTLASLEAEQAELEAASEGYDDKVAVAETAARTPPTRWPSANRAPPPCRTRPRG